ncbi:MAG TPA: right-handed parallel beta-helix repeat-containing protein, partial [Acidobacteriota bacterium]|nr:right-handed parallel beta-helix repeat-containing protein [Acidobacteriota bacterium]
MRAYGVLCALLMTVSVLCSADVLAVTHLVPTEHPTIQTGIDAALDGDTVLVAPGTYVENIDFHGKSVAVISAAGPGTTIITPEDPNDHTVRFVSGETTGTQLRGFTITGGGDVHTVIVSNASFALLTENVFRRNIPSFGSVQVEVVSCYSDAWILYNLFYENGGISCVGIRGGIETRIENNTFDRNARGFFSLTGGGYARNNVITRSQDYGVAGRYLVLDFNCLYLNFPDFSTDGPEPGPNNIIADPIYCDTVAGEYTVAAASPCLGAGEGGVDIGALGLGCLEPDPGLPGIVIRVPADYPTIQSAIDAVKSNDTVLVSPGVWVENIDFSGKGVRLIAEAGPATTVLRPAESWEYHIVIGDMEPAGTELAGFTILGCYGPRVVTITRGAAPHIHHNVFRGNATNLGNALFIGSDIANPTITHNQFVDNSGLTAVHVYSGGATVEHNTFDRNAVGLRSGTPETVARHNIITGSTEYGVGGTFAVLDYNCLFDNSSDYASETTPGLNDLAVDPEYCARDFRTYTLSGSSPCVGTGEGGVTIGALGVGCATPTLDPPPAALKVPGDQPIIQVALYVARDGDTVLVGPGHYVENVDFLWKEVALIGEKGSDSTFLEPFFPFIRTVQLFQHDGQQATFSGFTVSGGGAAQVLLIDGDGEPVVSHNVFRDYPLTSQNYSPVRCSAGEPLIQYNVFHDNEGISCVAVWAGGARIINNTFDDNARGFFSLSAAASARNNIVTNSRD